MMEAHAYSDELDLAQRLEQVKLEHRLNQSYDSEQETPIVEEEHIGGTTAYLEIGQIAAHPKSGRVGIIRFIGETKFAKGYWVGLELPEPLGKNDGAVDGTRYFRTKPNHGCFVAYESVIPYDPSTAATLYRQPMNPSSTSSSAQSSRTHSPPNELIDPHSANCPMKLQPFEHRMGSCVGCGKHIAARGIMFEKQFYHARCFKCVKCGRTIGETGEFFQKDKKPYCILCPPSIKAVRKTTITTQEESVEEISEDTELKHCFKCGLPVMNPIAFGLRSITFWHAHCFTCAKCGVRVNKKVFEKDGHPYCLLHKPQ